jgi:hypothetical protein
LGEFVTAFVGHDDPPNTPPPAPPQGDRYSLALAASGNVIGQVMASLVRDAFAVFQMKKITRHSDPTTWKSSLSSPTAVGSSAHWSVGADDRCAGDQCQEVDQSA